MLSIALALRPKLLIADEPTSNLDTTLQAAILDQCKHLKEEYGITILLITHDMGVVAQVADHVAVMYAGSVVEYADTVTLFDRPAHPYTWGLLQALPRLDDADRGLRTMRGIPPDMIDLPEECPFLPRCPKATTVCRTSPRPALRAIEQDHSVACFNEMRPD
jgi:oligopeptide/dipeptide ABC transporter ATP-binding protein